MRPITESLSNIDIAKGESSDFNKLIKAIGSDITNIFTKTNQNTENMTRSLGVIIEENLFLQKKIKDLEGQLYAIEQTIGSQENNMGYNYMYKTFHTAEDIEYTDSVIYHDADYGVLTLPHVNAQKIPLLKYSKEFLRRNIDIKVEIGSETVDLRNEPDLLNIIDGDATTFWSKYIETDNNTNYIDYTLTINMPLRILPNLSINSIGIKPHPMYSTTLLDIKYVDARNNTEVRLPSLQAVGETAVPVQEIENLKFVFNRISATTVKFYFRQPYYLQSGTTRKFIIGLRGIDLENINISAEEASFMTAFELPNKGRYFLRIMQPEAITLNDETYASDAITHELYYDRSSTIPFLFGSDISANINTVYIKTKISSLDGSIPAIKGIKLQYLIK